uniref:SWIM-type domain-containing protein n=1 Tax=Chryseobacterium endophyticum TaxID=1854762 RepID=A0AAU6WNG5_9FLAO
MYNISDLQNQFSKQKINKAKKLSIREFEETEKNRFVCFVDDETESYDVSLLINSKSEITGYSCECGSKDFCLHVLAMGIFMSENKTGKTSSRKGVKKKMSEAERAMEDLNSEELKTWLLEFFKKIKMRKCSLCSALGKRKKNFRKSKSQSLLKIRLPR